MKNGDYTMTSENKIWYCMYCIYGLLFTIHHNVQNVCCKCDYVELGSIAYLFNITIINNLRTIKPFISINMFP